MNGLPQKWTEASLSDLVEFNPKHDRSRISETISFVPMPAVSAETGAIENAFDRRLSEVWKSFTHFAENDVIFAKITPCMENGKSAVARGLTNGLACGSTEFHVLRSNGAVLPEYLWRFLRQKSFRRSAEAAMTGAVGQRRVPADYLKASKLPLPPLTEQRRIVSKLDALTARTARARAELDRIPALTARYKQAVLAKAFSGELTRDWRKVSGTELSAWGQRRVGELAFDIRYGTAARCSFSPSQTPVLRIPNITDGRIDTTDLKHATFKASEQAKLALQAGDMLVIRSNGSVSLVGRAAVVTKDVEGFLYAGYLIRLRLDQDRVNPDYLQRAFSEPAVRREIESFAKSTSGVNNINSEQLRSLVIPMAPLIEQAEIVRCIDRTFAEIDRLTAEAAAARCLLDRLDQAVLAKAFRGELAPQDPADESASALLDRISAERTITKARRGRRLVAA